MFHVEQNEPIHRLRPLAVAYSNESSARRDTSDGRHACPEKTRINPFGRTKLAPRPSHSSGGNVARDAATSKSRRLSPSARSRTTSALSSCNSRTAARRKATRFARGSTIVSLASGLTIAKGRPGRPPPAPTSTTEDPGGMRRAMAKLSTTCSPTTSASDRAPVRLTPAFHSIRRRQNTRIRSAISGGSGNLHSSASRAKHAASCSRTGCSIGELRNQESRQARKDLYSVRYRQHAATLAVPSLFVCILTKYAWNLRAADVAADGGVFHNASASHAHQGYNPHGSFKASDGHRAKQASSPPCGWRSQESAGSRSQPQEGWL